MLRGKGKRLGPDAARTTGPGVRPVRVRTKTPWEDARGRPAPRASRIEREAWSNPGEPAALEGPRSRERTSIGPGLAGGLQVRLPRPHDLPLGQRGEDGVRDGEHG